MKRVLSIVPVAEKPTAENALKADLGALDGPAPYAARLSPTGGLPVTHVALCGVIGDDKDESALAFTLEAKVWVYDMEADPGFPAARYEEMGLKPYNPVLKP